MRFMNSMRFMLFLAVAVCTWKAGNRYVTAADPETPTHVEVESIKIPLGNEGRLETIAMNREGEIDRGGDVAREETRRIRPGTRYKFESVLGLLG